MEDLRLQKEIKINQDQVKTKKKKFTQTVLLSLWKELVLFTFGGGH